MKIKKIDLFNVSTRYLVLSVNVLNLKIGIGCLVEKWSTDREHQQQKKKTHLVKTKPNPLHPESKIKIIFENSKAISYFICVFLILQKSGILTKNVQVPATRLLFKLNMKIYEMRVKYFYPIRMQNN